MPVEGRSFVAPAPLTPSQAAAAIRGGGVIAYPTEAVWGLGCDPANQAATLRLLSIKQRPVDKGLILIAAQLDQVRRFVNLESLPRERLDEVLSSWPGPHTWILPASDAAPAWVTGAHSGIAVRVSAHPVVAALCDACGHALVSTSANLAGAPPAHHRDTLDAALLRQLDGVVDGETGGLQRPTPIRDAATGVSLRE